MNKLSASNIKLQWLTATLIGCVSIPFASAQEKSDEEIFELSPFSVSADDQQGYRATSTLAGTRIKTNLKDVGAAISVATKEFLEDTGVTNMDELLTYTTGTEAGGASGNYAGSGAATGNYDANNQARANPVGNSRVRGLSQASTTRDFFLSPSWIGFDSYNTELVTINRGPNSILFGIGEPGGIVDNTLKRAVFGREINTLGLRYGSHGSYRATVDINRELIEGRLALRINALNENREYKQEPTYEKDKRYSAALTANLFLNEGVEWLDKTVLTANWEQARVNGTPPDPMPPEDRYSQWWETPGSKELFDLTGKKPVNEWSNDYAEWESKYISQRVEDVFAGWQNQNNGYYYRSQPAMWNSYAIVYANNTGEADLGYDSGPFADTQVLHASTGQFVNSAGQTTPGYFPLWMPSQDGPWGAWSSYGYRNHVIMDKNVWNWEEMLLQGKTQYVNHGYNGASFNLEQTFFKGIAGIQLSADKQSYDNERFFPFGRANYAAVKIDNNKYLTNGELNPNLGRPFLTSQYDPVNYFQQTYETKRATAFYTLDFTKRDGWMSKLGNHTFTGLISEWDKDQKNWGQAVSWDTNHDKDQNYASIIGAPGSWGGRMFAMAYLGDAQFDVTNPSGLKLYQQPLDLVLPKDGDYFNNYYYDKTTKQLRTSTVQARNLDLWPGRQMQNVKSEGLTLQSKLLENHLVATYGWREDRSQTWDIQGIQNLDQSYNLEKSFENFKNGGDPVLDQTGQTSTLQLVGHVPLSWTRNLPLAPELSVHYAESENFNPASVRRDIFNTVLGSPSGETTEKGVTIGLLENRATVRLNWFETSSKNVVNQNINSSLWAFFWPRDFAARWMQAKNQSYKEGGRPFSEQGWGSNETPNAQFYDKATGNFSSFDEVINTLLFDVLPPETVAALDPQIIGEPGNQQIQYTGITGLSSVADVVSEGFEIEATMNLTKNWRVSFNASKTESIFSNGVKELFEYRDIIEANFDKYGLWEMYEGGASSTTLIQNRWKEATNPLAAAAAKEGTVSTELRKWRWNAVTNYTFSEGRLKGLGVGGSVRWQDDVALGYPILKDAATGNFIPDLANPYFGGSDWHGDLWFSYKTKLFNDKVPVKFQLNLQNALGDDEPMPVSVNPDGQLAIIRSAPEKQWFFSTTLEF